MNKEQLKIVNEGLIKYIDYLDKKNNKLEKKIKQYEEKQTFKPQIIQTLPYIHIDRDEDDTILIAFLTTILTIIGVAVIYFLIS